MIPRSLRPRLLLGTIGLFGSLVAYLAFFGTNAESLFERAIGMVDSNPRRAEELLIQCIAISGEELPEARLALSQLFLRQNRCREALGAFGMIMDLDRCRGDDLYDLSVTAEKKDCLLLASLACEAACNSDCTKRSEAFKLLTTIRMRESDFARALVVCTRWCEVQPENVEAWYMKGLLQTQLLNPLAAIESFQASNRLAPNQELAAKIQSNLIPLLIDTGQFAIAEQHLNELDRDVSSNADRASLKARLRYQQGRLEEAKRLIDELSSMETLRSSAFLFLRGLIYFDLRQYDQSIESFTKVVEIDPRNKEAHFKLGQAFMNSGQPELAQAHLDESQRITQAVIDSMNRPMRSRSTSD